MTFIVKRLSNNPIIVPHMDERMGSNINGPSLIRVPEWLPHPLGKYYLYFGDHGGAYIRLAYADELNGPWLTYEQGVLPLEQSYFRGHIASPDVHVDHQNRRIVMYFHGVTSPQDQPKVRAVMDPSGYPGMEVQNTRVAVSQDGINFTAREPIEVPYYLRVFHWRDATYGLGMPGIFFRSRDGLAGFEPGPRRFTDDMRHNAVWVHNDKLHVFYTNANDCPERIYHSSIELTGNWNDWQVSKPVVLLEPETQYEGADLPLEKSRRGGTKQRVRQLRDPAIYEEDGRLYILYAVAGEHGIAIAELQ